MAQLNRYSVINDSGNRSAAIDFVKKGSKLIKVRSKFSKNERLFAVDSDEQILSYKKSQKKSCSKKKKTNPIYISDIQEVRSGSQSDAFSIAYGKKHQFPHDSQCFSLVIGEESHVLDLVAPNSNERNLWVRGIEELRQQLQFRSSNPAEVQQLWTKKLFHEADKDKNGTLCLKEITHLLNHMNLDVSENAMKKIVTKDSLNIEEFLNFLTLLLQKTEIVDEVFKKYDNGKMYWTKSDLQFFMSKEQKQTLTPEQCEKIILEMETCPELKKSHWLGLTGFTAFLESELMNIKTPESRTVYQDMTLPLSHYFIDSSHNTYLESDQLKGYSKVECYIKALKMGCRCVEMDVWDGDNSEPVIYHGFTLTSKLLFTDVIKVIDKYAFCKSKFPLILSIENHCSVEQQKKMASIMKDILKDKIFTDPLLPDSNFLPPPCDLMERIIIKCKKLPEITRHESKLLTAEVGSSVRKSSSVSRSIGSAAAANGDDDEDGDDEPDTVEELHEIAVEFSELINICQTAKFKNFPHSKENHNFTFICSFSESKALSLAKTSPREFIQHNKCQLSRIYPAGSRFGSTNYDPVPYWLVGCQVAALNYQTPDEPMQLNRGLFGDNGGCGYVLKPDFLRSFNSNTTFSPDAPPFPATWHQTVTLKVLSGFCLPKKEGDCAKSILDPYVQVSVVGVPYDKKTLKTKVIHNNGFHPVWNESLKFYISCPQLALLHIQVCDHESRRSDVVIAQICLSVRCIQRGYRTVALRAVSGEKLPSAKLYVHVEIT